MVVAIRCSNPLWSRSRLGRIAVRPIMTQSERGNDNAYNKDRFSTACKQQISEMGRIHVLHLAVKGANSPETVTACGKIILGKRGYSEFNSNNRVWSVCSKSILPSTAGRFFRHTSIYCGGGSLRRELRPRGANHPRSLLSAYQRLPNRNTGTALAGTFIAEVTFD